MEELEFEQGGQEPNPLTFLFDPMGIVRRRWRWILVLLTLGTVVGVAVVLNWPTRYQATAKLLFSAQHITADFVRSPVATTIEEDVNTMVGEVLAADSLRSLVEGQGLGRAGESPSPGLLDQVRSSISIYPYSEMEGGRGRVSYIYEISFEHEDPQKAADVANALVDRLKEAHLSRRSERARVTTEFLRREMEETEAELNVQVAKISDFKQLHRGQLPSELPTHLARLDRLQQQRDSLALQISDAESRLISVRSEGSPDDARVELLAQLRSRLANEQAVHTDDHPNVTSLRRQVNALQEDLERNPVGTSNSSTAIIERELASLRDQLARAENKIQDLDARVAIIPDRQEEIDALLRRESVLRESFASASRKVEESELAENLERSQQGIKVSRLEAAWPPSQPKRPLPVLAGVAAGAVLGLALGVALLLELLDPVLLSPQQVEAETGLVNLGTVPKIG
jgi:uncharacterized protein involved in exopolysaccharide biosynthesis